MAVTRVDYADFQGEVAGAAGLAAWRQLVSFTETVYLIYKDFVRRKKDHTLLAGPLCGDLTIKGVESVAFLQINAPERGVFLWAGRRLP